MIIFDIPPYSVKLRHILITFCYTPLHPAILRHLPLYPATFRYTPPPSAILRHIPLYPATFRYTPPPSAVPRYITLYSATFRQIPLYFITFRQTPSHFAIFRFQNGDPLNVELIVAIYTDKCCVILHMTIQMGQAEK